MQYIEVEIVMFTHINIELLKRLHFKLVSQRETDNVMAEKENDERQKQ